MTIKTVSILITIASLFFISEGIYQLLNNPSVQIPVYLYLARLSAKTGDVKNSLNYFEKAYSIRLGELSYSDRQEFRKEKDFPKFPENQKLIDEYKDILGSLEINKFTNTYDVWGKTLYNLGIVAYQNAERDLVIPFWETAVQISPEWSYFHIELANYYLTNKMQEEAIAQLDYCLKFKHPKSFCQWYIDNHLELGKPDTVGFLEGKINEEI